MMKRPKDIRKKIRELKKKANECKKNYLMVMEGELRSQIDILGWVLNNKLK